MTYDVIGESAKGDEAQREGILRNLVKSNALCKVILTNFFLLLCDMAEMQF